MAQIWNPNFRIILDITLLELQYSYLKMKLLVINNIMKMKHWKFLDLDGKSKLVSITTHEEMKIDRKLGSMMTTGESTQPKRLKLDFAELIKTSNK